MKSKKINIFIIIFTLVLVANVFLGSALFQSATVVYAEDESATNGYGYKIIESYESEWPEGIVYNIQYDRYPAYPNYIVNIDGNRQRVYQAPSSDAHGIDSLYYGERCQVLDMVENDDGELWYSFMTNIEGDYFVGFIKVDKVEKREFQILEMNNRVQELAGMGTIGPVVYIENYRSVNGYAPDLPNGEYYDQYGNRRGQSAAGYQNKELTGVFRYIPDGMLCIVEEIRDITDIETNNIVINSMGEYVPMTGGAQTASQNTHSPESIQAALNTYNENGESVATKLYIPSFGVSLWIESKYIDMDKKMQGGFGQVVVVDRKNQNIAVFEYNQEWTLISTSFSTTGKSSATAVPTPLGYFMALEKKEKFEYRDEEGGKIEGFAPHAIRFSGGGYLHGVPMKYEFDSTGKQINVTNFTESILSIGTVPESHMCIRNFTSHALFMYERVIIGNCAVIVIE